VEKERVIEKTGWLCNFKEEIDYEVAPYRTGPPGGSGIFLATGCIG
jgi:hypothetical protein